RKSAKPATKTLPPSDEHPIFGGGNIATTEEKPEVETLPPRVERKRARRRKAEAGKANLPTVSAGNISLTHEEKGQTRDKVAAAVGLGSGRTYETAKKVWEAAKNGDETAKKLVEELDAGKTTVHAAYKKLM